MCGRFVITTNADELIKHFGLDIQDFTKSEEQAFVSYNVAPSQTVPIIHHDDQQHKVLSAMQWGLLPAWALRPETSPRPINARIETLHEKPTFRSSLAQRRCLIPASGFYEWDKDTKPKKPYYFYKPEQKLFAFAGLWALWEREASTIFSFAIITTVANDSVKTIHDRMPVILEQDQYEPWLNQQVLPPTMTALTKHAVNFEVNNPKCNEAVLINIY